MKSMRFNHGKIYDPRAKYLILDVLKCIRLFLRSIRSGKAVQTVQLLDWFEQLTVIITGERRSTTDGWTKTYQAIFLFLQSKIF